MITIYVTTYDLKEGNKKYQTEHQEGLSLLCYGLENLYNLVVDKKQLLTIMGHGERGKPYLKQYAEIHFNISHCDGMVACAFSDKPIGIDMEQIDDFKDSLMRKILTDEEQEFLIRYKKEKENYKELFYRFWTLKESYLKWDGSGFYKDPKEVSFEMNLNGQEGNKKALITCSDTRVGFWQEKIEENCILSVCTESISTSLHWMNMQAVTKQKRLENGKILNLLCLI